MKLGQIKIVFLILFFVSCKNEKRIEYQSIDLSSEIKAGQGIYQSLNNIVSEYSVYPLQTSDTALLPDITNIQIKQVSENDIWLSTPKAIYRFEKETGKCLSVINKCGQGPEEYNFIFDCVVDTIDKSVSIRDGNMKKMIKYDFNGIFKESVFDDFTGSFALLNDSAFIVSYSPVSNHNCRVGFYDKKWNLINDIMPKNDSLRTNNFIYYDVLTKFRDDFCIAIPFNDTIYRFHNNKSEPCFVISKGNFKISESIASDISRKKERAKYIFGEYGFFISSYYFSFYMYQNKVYNDVWNLNNSLLYRNIRANIEDKDGLLFIIDDKETYIKPKFVFGNYLYCISQASEVMDSIPFLQKDDNPVIIELKLKEI